MTIDIICPLYKAEKYIEKLQRSFENQKNVSIKTIRYVITQCEDQTEQKVNEIEKNNKTSIKIIHKIIKPQEFSHSLTREKEAFESDADIIVFVTQDVIIERDDWLKKLTVPIEKNECDETYSRQLCKNNSIEKYTRENNYPSKSKIVSKDDIGRLGLKTFFSSDASSAIKRITFIKLNGYDGKKIPTSEDMYITYKLIMNGYKVKYCADSEVIHSHAFSCKQQYEKYVLIGKFFKQNNYLNQYKVTKAGGGMAKLILKRAWQDKNWKVLREFIPNMAARLIGMKVGNLKGE